jgi:hypothetical protein
LPTKVAAVTFDKSGGGTELADAATQTAPYSWPRSTITTTMMAPEKVTTTAAATTSRSEMWVNFA